MQKITNKSLKPIGIDNQILMPDSDLTVSDSIAAMDSVRVLASLKLIEITPVVEEAPKAVEVPEMPAQETPAEEPVEAPKKTSRKKKS